MTALHFEIIHIKQPCQKSGASTRAGLLLIIGALFCDGRLEASPAQFVHRCSASLDAIILGVVGGVQRRLQELLRP